jgi:hypothetical protein
MIRTHILGSAGPETFRRRIRKMVVALATMLLPFGAWGMDGSPKLPIDSAGNPLPLPPISLSGFDAVDELEAERSDFQSRYSSVARECSTRLLPYADGIRARRPEGELKRGGSKQLILDRQRRPELGANPRYSAAVSSAEVLQCNELD